MCTKEQTEQIKATMKNLTFGVEIETSCRHGRWHIARAISQFVGNGWVDVTHDGYDRHICKDSKGRDWIVCRDGSVNGISCEIVSPPLSLDDMPLLQDVIRVVRKAGAKVDSSCGIHIHVGSKDLTTDEMIRLAKLFDKYEPIIEQSLNILPSRRTYCKPFQSSGFVARLKSIKGKISDEKFRELWYVGNEFNTQAKYNDSRYHTLQWHNHYFQRDRNRNPNASTVEFRCFNSTLHAGKVRAYVEFVLAMTSKSINSKSIAGKRRVFRPETAKYDIRAWMVKLGLIGDEFKTCRQHMMSLFTGSSRTANTGIARGGNARRAI